MTNPTPYALTDAKLHEAAAAAINARLDDLTWLACYGPVQRLTKQKEGRNYIYPAVYVSGSENGDYLDLLPDYHLAPNGGYSYLEFSDPQRVRNWRQNPALLQLGFSLIVWFDFRKVYPSPADWKAYGVANVVQTVLNELAKGTGQASIADELDFSYSGERIYRGYSSNEIDRQFLMKPFGGFRIDGTLFFNQTC